VHDSGNGTKRTSRLRRTTSAIKGKAENICSTRVFRLLTPIGSRFLGIGPSGRTQFGRPPSVDIVSIRLIGRLVG
ncbi:MAG: hypothetical protein WA269_12470, partial [Candidatus Udaeobacter sp.]